MNTTKVDIQGLLVIEPKVFADERGYFYESYNAGRYNEAGMPLNFYQDNVSKSVKGTIRGLHYQVGENAQGKLVSVLKGSVLDVAVDIRSGSPTFGRYYSVELSEHNKKQLWIPKGFAHGFSVLSDEAVFHYKCTASYDQPNEKCIRYDDEQLAIDWKIEQPIVSPKDLAGVCFKDIDKDFVY